MTAVHEGGCVCGAVRYRVEGTPDVALVCHCRFCQRRTGSAFAAHAYFEERAVTFLQGERAVCEHRSDESGRWLRMEFCPKCGTTVSHTAEVRPGMRAITAGTFDDPGWLKIDRHVWTRSARPWVHLPDDVDAYAKGSAGTAPTRPRRSS